MGFFSAMFFVLCAVLFAQEQPETIVITAPAPEEESAPGTIAITAEEARRSGARTVAEAIESVPGISLQSSGSSYEPVLLRIRGSTSEQVLVLRDGRPLTDSYSGIVDLARVPLDNVERIEIIRGPVNALYGGGAAGAINIVTTGSPPPTASPWSGEGRYSYGSLGEHRAGAGVTFTGDDLSLGVATNGVVSTNSYDYHYDGASRTRENAGGRDGLIQLAIDNRNREALVESDLELTLEGSRRGAPGSVEFPTTNAVVTDDRISMGLGAEIAPQERTALRASVDAARLTRRFFDDEYPLGALESETDLRTVGGELVGERTVGPLEVGVTLAGRYTTIDDLELGTVDRRSAAVAPAIAVGDRTRIETAGRLEYVDDSLLPSGRATFAVAPWELMRFGLVASAGYRLPTFLELFYPVGAFVVGNPGLDPERSSSIEAEVTVGRSTTAELRASAYIVQYRELIQWIAGPDGRWSPRNTGTARVRGLETEGRLALPPAIGSWTTSITGRFELIEAIDTNEGVTDGKQLPYRPRAATGGGLTISHPFGHSVRLDAEYIGARPINAQNTAWLDPHLAIDLSARARLPVGGVEEWFLFLSIDNLLDEPYIETRYYPNPGLETVVGTEVRW